MGQFTVTPRHLASVSERRRDRRRQDFDGIEPGLADAVLRAPPIEAVFTGGAHA